MFTHTVAIQSMMFVYNNNDDFINNKVINFNFKVDNIYLIMIIILYLFIVYLCIAIQKRHVRAYCIK